VVGRKKFVYDLWGDTMNVAESMEANGVPGRIQVSAVTHERLHTKYILEPRGLVSIKDRPEMMAYFLVGRKENKPG
jgi:class 3 adenylate cyclase